MILSWGVNVACQFSAPNIETREILRKSSVRNANVFLLRVVWWNERTWFQKHLKQEMRINVFSQRFGILYPRELWQIHRIY